MKRRSLLKAGAAGSVAATWALGSAGPTAAVGPNLTLPLSSFRGLTDDDRLAAFMSYAAVQTLRGTAVLLDEASERSSELAGNDHGTFGAGQAASGLTNRPKLAGAGRS